MRLPMHFGESASECITKITRADNDKSCNTYLRGKKTTNNLARELFMFPYKTSKQRKMILYIAT